jgi:hypothetical protein
MVGVTHEHLDTFVGKHSSRCTPFEKPRLISDPKSFVLLVTALTLVASLKQWFSTRDDFVPHPCHPQGTSDNVYRHVYYHCCSWQ